MDKSKVTHFIMAHSIHTTTSSCMAQMQPRRQLSSSNLTSRPT